MRLLNTRTLEFEEFFGEAGNGIPRYAILSHTWGLEEVSYKDHAKGEGSSKQGWGKVRNCSQLANSEGFDYLWIDACCIDKSSSAELSEAINSMFQWYRGAAVCYAHLSDVPSSEDPALEGSSFFRSRWFTRGWTLQELLAPKELVFVGADWKEIGTKRSLRVAVSRITGIAVQTLDKQSWPEYSTAQKMSWAAGRQTTRLEDEAYCLMGLFNISMPMLYGEGRRAFSRLQQEILRQSDDQSLFAWSYPKTQHAYTCTSGLLAPTPEHFRHASNIHLLPYGTGEEYETAFELVHQLVRMKLRSADRVEGLRLRAVETEPAVSIVVEARQAGFATEARGQHAPATVPTMSSPPRQEQDEPRVVVDGEEPGNLGGAAGSDPEQQQRPAIPTITIEVEDSEPAPEREPLGAPVVFLDSRIERISQRADFEGPSRAGEQGGGDRSSSPSLQLESTPGTASWHWFIYEPVIVVPLRCKLGSRRLGILFSRSAIGGEGGVLSRLHYPSLVAIGDLGDLQLSPIAKYVRIAPPTQEGRSQWRPWEAKPWPEIRITPTLSKGYSLHSTAGPNWELDKEQGVLTPKNQYHSQHGATVTELAPLALFHSLDALSSKAAPSFFLSLPACEPQYLICEVGIFQGSHAATSSLDFRFYSCDLASVRHAKIPLSPEQSVTVRYREGAGVSYIILAVEASTENIGFPVLASCRETRTPWLTQRLFPILRSMRGAAVAGAPRLT